MVLQFLDDTFKTMRCSSRCGQINECSGSNAEVPIADEVVHHHHQHRQHTHEQIIDTQPHHNNEHDEDEHAI